MKRRIRGTILGLVMLSVLAVSVSAKASVDNGAGRLNFQQFKIYGSQQTLMATGYTQYSPYGTINVIVDNMYKTDGSASTYRTSLWTVTNTATGAVAVDRKEVTVGKEIAIEVNPGNVSGVRYDINVKGNSSADALISGSVKNFNKI